MTPALIWQIFPTMLSDVNRKLADQIDDLGLPKHRAASPEDVNQGELDDCYLLAALFYIGRTQTELFSEYVFVRVPSANLYTLCACFSTGNFEPFLWTIMPEEQSWMVASYGFLWQKKHMLNVLAGTSKL